MKNATVSIIGTRGYPSYYGGFETAVRKLAPYLVDHGWDTTVYSRPGATKENDSSRDQRVKTVYTKGIDSRAASTLSYGFTAFLRAVREKPDVILVMNVANGFFLPLAKIRGIATVVNVDGMEWKRAKWGPAAKMMFRMGARLTAQFASSLIADSVEISKQWNEEFGVDSTFIPYGADPKTVLPIEPGLSHRGYVLFVARLVPENTVREFLDAAAELSQDWPIVIVGSSGYGDEIEADVRRLIESCPNVRWLGQVSDDKRLLSLWEHAGVYFHGHSVGGTNPALVQAMAAGAPIVARDTAYSREVLGDAGLFVSPSSANIVATVSRLLHDPKLRLSLSAKAQRRAASKYTWEGVCAAYEMQLATFRRCPSQDADFGSSGASASEDRREKLHRTA